MSAKICVEGLVRAIFGPLWWMYYGRAIGGRTEVPEPHNPTGGKKLFHFEIPVCYGRITLGYLGIILASLLWKNYFGLLRDHFG